MITISKAEIDLKIKCNTGIAGEPDDALKHCKCINSKMLSKKSEAIMKKLILLLTVLSVTSFTGGRANAESVINLKLGSDYTDYFLGAALNNTDGQTWTVLDQAGPTLAANLLDSNGVGTGVSVNYNMNGSNATSTTAFADLDNQPLMLGFLNEGGVLDFSGLAAGTYKIYVYSQGETSATNSLSMSTKTASKTYNFSFVNNGDLASFTKAIDVGDTGNYAVQTVDVGAAPVTGYSGNLVMTFAGGGYVNGIQIQAVPEPGSVILLGVGGIFVLGFMRMRAKGSSEVCA